MRTHSGDWHRGHGTPSTATKTRILDAAVVEFAEFGLAGARVADRAHAKRQLLYAHFGNKESLFDTAMEASLAAILDEVPFDANDLPSYAVFLRKFADDNPHLLRRARWHSLERPGVFVSLPMAINSTVAKLQALEEAQRAGVIDDALTPQQLLAVTPEKSLRGRRLGLASWRDPSARAHST